MKYVCDVCGWEYDEELGDPEHGIAPGTKFEDLPDDFAELARIPSPSSKKTAYSHSIFGHADGDAVAFLLFCQKILIGKANKSNILPDMRYNIYCRAMRQSVRTAAK